MSGHDRAELFERTHSVVVRTTLSSEGRTVSFSPQVSQSKPGTGTPDMQILYERRLIEQPLVRWLASVTDAHDLPSAKGMEAIHAAITAATAHELDELAGALGEAEVRLGIEWKDGEHSNRDAEPETARRSRMHRLYLHRHFGKPTSTAAVDEGITIEQMRYVRQCHGINGRDGTRKEACPAALASRSVHEYCPDCVVVDDLAAEADLAKKRAA